MTAREVFDDLLAAYHRARLDCLKQLKEDDEEHLIRLEAETKRWVAEYRGSERASEGN